MQLTVVGCSGSTSGPDSPASSYLLQAPHQGRLFSLVLDLGPGAFGALYRYVDPSAVDAFALSHLHPDHCLDLCAYFVAARYSSTAPWPRREVYGPAGSGARLSSAYEVAGSTALNSGIADQLDCRSWQPVQQIGPFEVRVARVRHPVEAYAIRVEERVGGDDDPPGRGPAMVFSGDTGPCKALVELSAGVDLLLVEAGFPDQPDNPVDLHLTARQAAEAATAAGVGRVVLTHIPPWGDPAAALAEARLSTHVPVELARSGRHWVIGAGSGAGVD